MVTIGAPLLLDTKHDHIHLGTGEKTPDHQDNAVSGEQQRCRSKTEEVRDRWGAEGSIVGMPGQTWGTGMLCPRPPLPAPVPTPEHWQARPSHSELST